ncbi:MAG: hypothetical protein ACXAC2_19205, partial [Candidatus Kariarchaeaceae archaeon]
AKAIATHPNYKDPKPFLDEGFRLKFKENTIVRRAVLDGKIEQLLDENRKSKAWFAWNRYDWAKEEFPLLDSLDNYLIDSLTFRDTDLRSSVISILGRSSLSSYDFIDSHQWQAFFDIWNGLYQNSLELDFIKLSDYKEKSLEEFFGDKFLSLYEDMRLSEIHPHQFRKLTMALLPRSLLFSMARDDPMEDNRTMCYEYLTTYDFFFDKREGKTKLIGSIDFVYQVLKRCITAMQHETSEETQLKSYKQSKLWIYINHLMKMLGDIPIQPKSY